MKKLYYFFSLISLLLTPGLAWSQEQQKEQNITGQVLTESDEPLSGAAVVVNGTFLGSATNGEGAFLIPVTGTTFPLLLNVSYLGYQTQKINVQRAGEPLTITLIPDRAATNQIVVVASRQEENILRVPVTLEKVTQSQIRQFSRPDLLSSLGRLKGIDANVSSFAGNSISTRGFNSPTSERLIQLLDYMDIQTPSFNAALGMLGPIDLDVASVEVLYGPSSALYGANAFNGVVLFNSRDAFTDQGLDVRLRGGQRDFLDGQIRYARRLSRRWAVKFSGSYLTGRDWIPQNYSAQQPSRLVTVNNPTGSLLGYDAVNRYGDAGLTFSDNPQDPAYGGALAGRTVFLPGWTERELLAGDDHTMLYRLMPSVSYLLTNKIKLTADFRRNFGNTIVQSTTRFRSKNWTADQYRLSLEGDGWFVRAFQARDFGKDVYDLNYLGGFLQTSINPATGRSYAQDYFGTYAQAYNFAYLTGSSDEQAQATAQAAAASIQLQAGTPAFEALRQVLIQDNTPGRGARIRIKSRFNDVSAQYRYNLNFVDLTVGGAYRDYLLDRNGRLYEGAAGLGRRNYEYGGYAQFTRTLLQERLKLAAVGRLDNFQNFKAAFSPRASAVYSFGDKLQHNFRGSYSRAFRAPSQFDQYSNIDVSVAVVRGNVGTGFQGYSPALGAELGRISTSANPSAELAAYELNVAPLRLEQVNSFEIGYKGIVAPSVVLDLSYYRSYYNDFVQNQLLIGNQDGSQPSFAQLAAAAPGRFQNPELFTRVLVVPGNLDLLVRTHGALASVTYTPLRTLNLSGNYSLNVLLNSSEQVPFYNTPKHKFNVGAYGELTRQLGYNVNYRWAQGHRYETTFATGDLRAYHSLDAQLRYALPKLATTLEAGGSNILNSNNLQVYGSPQIGRLVYVGVNLSVK